MLEFPLSIQKKIIKKFLTDKKFAGKYVNYITTKFFDTKELKSLYKAFKKYFLKYDKLPTIDALEQLVGTDNEFTLETLQEILSLEIQEEDFIVEQVQRFILFTKTKEAIINGAEILSKQKENVNPDEIISIIQEVSKIKFEDEGYYYFKHTKERVKNIKDIVKEKIATGIRDLDLKLEGGLGRGELGIIMGVTGFGKTLFLQNFAYSAIVQKKNVIYYTFEDKEIELAYRFDKIFSQMTLQQIQTHQSEFISKIKRLYKKYKSRLLIKWFPMYQITPYYIKSDIESLRIKGFNPDLVIVDYGQRLASPRKYGDRWQELVMIYDLLSTLAISLDVPVWTAAQLQKQVLTKNTPDLLHAAGAKNISDGAHVVLMIAQTPEEKSQSLARLFLAKARRRQSRSTVKVKIDYDTMVVRSFNTPDKFTKPKILKS